MEFILKYPSLILVDAFAAMTRTCRVTALEDESWDKAVENCVVVVAIEAVLKEITRCEGGLFGEEFEGEVPGGCVEEHFSRGLGLEVIKGRHSDLDY